MAAEAVNPYESQPAKAYWKLAVGERQPLEIDELWKPKFNLSRTDPVATLGSCFAQHISQALVRAGYSWLDSEPAPKALPQQLKAKFNYGIFSARLGNIYTTALLKQWVSWAFELQKPTTEVWESEGRFFDPFRPAIEPNGFASKSELLEARATSLRALKEMFGRCKLFVFTLGLTEAWLNSADSVVYPMCPGTVAGKFIPQLHQFKNYNFSEIYSDLAESCAIIREHNPTIHFVLTVSPVPLTATATSEHVLVATTYSKSVLRAVAGQLAASSGDTDYFPSYEIISAFPFKGLFYEQNMRTVTSAGVDFVMRTFFNRLDNHLLGAESKHLSASERTNGRVQAVAPDDVHKIADEVCEDLLLEAYGSKKS